MPSNWWGWGEEGRTYHLPDPERYVGREGLHVLASVKWALDPAGVMNPGKLVAEPSALPGSKVPPSGGIS